MMLMILVGTSTHSGAALLALAGAVLLALAIDHHFGEPPTPLHPVVWMGRALEGAAVHIAPSAPTPTGKDRKAFWGGALVWCGLGGLIFLASYALQTWLLATLPAWAAALGLGVCLKPLFAWRMLRSEVQAVETALAQSLSAGRERLSWLVSRETDGLEAVAVRESAIETLAENLNDSVIAPIFWFLLWGLPGAALYRFANTADAMWGYPAMRGGRYWQWAGKWAARADDGLSWIPARITAGLLWSLSPCKVPWGVVREQAQRTPSPNSGWPMAAMALALNVRLSKPHVYTLHPEGQAAQPQDVARALQLAAHTVIALSGLTLVAIVLIAKNY